MLIDLNCQIKEYMENVLLNNLFLQQDGIGFVLCVHAEIKKIIYLFIMF